MHCSQWKRKLNNGKSEHANLAELFRCQKMHSFCRPLLPAQGEGVGGTAAWGQRTRACGGAGTGSQGSPFRGDGRWPVSVTANLRAGSAAAGPAGPRVPVGKWSCLRRSTSSGGPGGAKRACEVRGLDALGGARWWTQMSPLGQGGRISL